MIKDIAEMIDAPDVEITANTVISSCDAIDSTSLLEIMVYLKKNGFNGSIADVAKCVTVGDIARLIG